MLKPKRVEVGLISSPIQRGFINIIMWVLGVLWIVPFLGIFMTSIRPYSEVVIHGWWSLSPFSPTLENYKDVILNPMFSLGRGMVNSAIIATLGTVIPIAIAALAAYAFARFSFPIKKYLFITILFIMAIPQQMAIIPLFFLLKDIHLLNTRLGLVLVHSAWGIPWTTFFLRNYFSMLPAELEEAARVDGATDIQVFRRVVLPLALPGIISAAVIQFSWVWKDFFLALMLIFDPNKMVVTQMLPSLKGQYEVDWGLLSAGAVLAMSVPLILYALFNKYYMRGFTGWAMKK